MNSNDIIQKLKNNEIKLYEVEKYLYSSSDSSEIAENSEITTSKATDIRRKYIEDITNTDLNHIASYSIDLVEAEKKNIENSIGAIQIPIGIAGPLKINGKYADGEFFIPLASSEGALVASVNRGSSAITLSGGVNTRVIDDKMTRAPILKTKSITKSIAVKQWFEDNFQKLKEIAESTTNHGKLIKIDPIFIVGNYVYPRFVYSTGDSMGMNMVTIATEKVLEILSNEKDVELIALSGNVCVDKKPSAINLIEGRGKSVVADIIIPKEIVKNKLKTTAEAVEQVNIEKNLIGSAVSGSMGFNAHYANMIGAIFLATGQDEAHIVEGSLGITTAENRNGDLYFSVNMPDLPIATVGGGTSIETARESLSILGIEGTGDVKKFAEIIIATVLAGELSLMSALAAGHLARAHKELGRNNF